MLTSNQSPHSSLFQENLDRMAADLSEVSGKKYIIERESRPVKEGGGFYYARRDSRLAAIVDKVFPSFGAAVVITGMHYGDTGELEVNLTVRNKKYKSLVERHMANFYKGVKAIAQVT